MKINLKDWEENARLAEKQKEYLAGNYEGLKLLIQELRRLAEALERFSGLSEAVHPTGAYHEDVIIQCETTAGDIYEMQDALASLKEKIEL